MLLVDEVIICQLISLGPLSFIRHFKKLIIVVACALQYFHYFWKKKSYRRAQTDIASPGKVSHFSVYLRLLA